MPHNTGTSKVFAGIFMALTVGVISGTIAMVILYNIDLQETNPTPPPTFAPTTTEPPPVMRLPKSLVPESYNVFFQPHLYTRIIQEVNVTSPNQTFLFTGNSTVHFHCVRNTFSIFLHSKDLQVSDPLVMNKDKNEKMPATLKHHGDETDFLEVQVNDVLEAGGNYSLFLAFRGEISDNLEALFLSTYVEGEPEYEGDTDAERFLAATNLQPTDARRLFPCFDEPEMKAVFHVTVIHRRDTTALGNAAVLESVIIDDEWKSTRFHATPRMSTYLLAFTLSEFPSVPSSYERVSIKTFARPEAIAAGHADYAASITGKMLSFYETFLGINYEQSKLDQIALPDLLPSGMENWGLVTYRQGDLLFEEGVSSLLYKEDIANLIAHELAHQWFGNLVTMKWWNEIWLNEGLASYMSDIAVDAVEPTFNIKDIFVMNKLHSAFERDALTSSHPLSPPAGDVQTTDQIEGMFDTISYSKGAIVLRMLEDFVGESVFHKGIKMYLRAFKGQNTDQNNLWDSIQKAEDETRENKNIAEVMHGWTNQMGYPVITINTTTGQIYQKQFLFNNSVESSLSWKIPINFMSNVSTTSRVWLYVPGPVKYEEFIDKNKGWILVNVNCTGYYRVNYNQENWHRLLTQLETNQHRIPLMNRGQLIDDAFNLARAKLLDVALALNSTRFLSNEREYLPWESAIRNLEYFVLMFDRTEVNGPMQAYLRKQVKGLYNYYYNYSNYTDGSNVPTDHSAQHNQINAIEVACSSGLPECIEMVQEKFANWMSINGTNTIHPNLRYTIYCQAVAAGGKKEWEFAWNKYLSSSDTSEREQLQYALSCTKKIWLLNRYLEYTLDPEKIRLMDVPSIIYYIGKNVAGQALAWNFIRAHWEYVSQGGGSVLINGVTSRFSTQFELEELERFAADYDVGAAFRTVAQAIEQTRVNIQWVSENRDTVLQWFERETASVDW